MIRTLNLKSPVGGLPYGIPKKAQYFFPVRTDVISVPRSFPCFTCTIILETVSETETLPNERLFCFSALSALSASTLQNELIVEGRRIFEYWKMVVGVGSRLYSKNEQNRYRSKKKLASINVDHSFKLVLPNRNTIRACIYVCVCTVCALVR